MLKDALATNNRSFSPEREGGGFSCFPLIVSQVSRRVQPWEIWAPTPCSQRNWSDAAPQPKRLEICLDNLRSREPGRKNSGAREAWEHTSNLFERRIVIEAVAPLLDYSFDTVRDAARCLKILRATEMIPLIEKALGEEPNPNVRADIERYLNPLRGYPHQPAEPDAFLAAIDARRVIADVERALAEEPVEIKKEQIAGYLERLKLTLRVA